MYLSYLLSLTIAAKLERKSDIVTSFTSSSSKMLLTISNEIVMHLMQKRRFYSQESE